MRCRLQQSPGDRPEVRFPLEGFMLSHFFLQDFSPPSLKVFSFESFAISISGSASWKDKVKDLLFKKTAFASILNSASIEST